MHGGICPAAQQGLQVWHLAAWFAALELGAFRCDVREPPCTFGHSSLQQLCP